METSLVNFRNVSEIADARPPADAKNVEYAVHTTGVLPNLCLVAMATSLENLGNDFEITNHENTTMTEKMEV